MQDPSAGLREGCVQIRATEKKSLRNNMLRPRHLLQHIFPQIGLNLCGNRIDLATEHGSVIDRYGRRKDVRDKLGPILKIGCEVLS